MQIRTCGGRSRFASSHTGFLFSSSCSTYREPYRIPHRYGPAGLVPLVAAWSTVQMCGTVLYRTGQDRTYRSSFIHGRYDTSSASRPLADDNRMRMRTRTRTRNKKRLTDQHRRRGSGDRIHAGVRVVPCRCKVLMAAADADSDPLAGGPGGVERTRRR